MDEYNAKIIYKCFSNELDYIYGLHAIKSELKLRNKVKKCESCKRKYLKKCWKYARDKDNWCDVCNDPNKLQQHMNFDYYKLLTYENYFDCVPNEIISLIFDNLSEYEVMNFYIAMQYCDRENFIKIAYWAQVHCANCKYIKKKYFHCNMCNLRLCIDCTQKCTYCDNRIEIIKYKQNDINKNSPYYLNDYNNYEINYQNTCLEEWSTCSDNYGYMKTHRGRVITKKEYDLSILCDTCGESICRNCIACEYMPPGVDCDTCYSK